MASRAKQPLLFNIFHMNTASHFTHGTWRHPDSKAIRYNDIDYWVDVAKLCERGGLDAIFFADVAGLYPEWGGSHEFQVERGMQVPISDPMPLISALGAATEHLGFILTSSVLQHPPFTFARTASTLDHLTKGRFAWNIVTSFTKNPAENVGLETLPTHDERYSAVEEYLEVCYKLWEGSWEDGAVVLDAEHNRFNDPSKVHPIDHVGPRYRVKGPHLVEPSPQRTPVLYQAGTSPQGQAFASRHAEGIFVIARNPEGAAKVVEQVTERAASFGRPAEDLHFVQGLSFVVGSTEAEAKSIESEIDSFVDEEAFSVLYTLMLGFDLGNTPRDMPLTELVKVAGGARGTIQRMIDAAPAGQVPTVGDIMRNDGRYNRITGSPEQIADKLEAWRDAGITGVNIVSLVTPKSWEDFVDHVAPVLKKRGLMKKEYSPGTLREKLYPGRGPLLQDHHPAAGYRRTPAS